MNTPIHKGTNKRIVVNTICLYLRVFIVLFLSLFSTRFVLEGLGEVNFGLYNLIAGVVALFGFISATLASVTQRFISYEIGASQNIERVRLVFNTSVRLHLVASAIVTAVVLVGGSILIRYFLNIPEDRIDMAYFVLMSVAVGIAVTISGVPYEAMLMAHENIVYVAFVQIGSSILKFLAAVSIVYIGREQLRVYAVLMACVPIMIMVSELWYVKTHYREASYISISMKNNPVRAEMLNFALLSIWGNFGWAIKHQGISIILNILWGVTVNAANGVATQVNGALLSLSSSLTTSIRPQLVQSAGEKSYDRMLSLASSACKYPLMILSVAGIPIFVALPMVLGLWLTEVPDYSVMFCRFLLAELIINQSTMGIALILDATGDIKRLHMLVGSSLILSTVLAYFAGRIFLVPQALYWCVIMNACFIGLVRVVLVRKKLQVLSTNKNIDTVLLDCIVKPLVLIVVLISVAFVSWHHIDHTTINLFVFILATVMVSFTSYLVFVLNKSEKEKIKAAATKLFMKLR